MVVDLVVGLLDQLLQLLVVLLPLFLGLDRQALPSIELVVLVEDVLVHLFDLLKELIEVFLYLFHFLYLFPCDVLLAALRSGCHTLNILSLSPGSGCTLRQCIGYLLTASYTCLILFDHSELIVPLFATFLAAYS